MHLTDGDRIRGRLATYCRLIDAGDFAGVGALRGDAMLCTQDGTRSPPKAAEVERLDAGLVLLHEDGTPGAQHVVADTAVPPPPIITGTYVDTVAPDPSGEGWHLTECRSGVGRSGVLGQHLTITL